jgi:hypothetical protein
MSDELQATDRPLSEINKKGNKSFSDHITLYVGIIGSLVTITLTILNAHTKNVIDDIEMKIKDRVTKIEESKEKVDRCKWVLSLFPDLTNEDEKKRYFTTVLTKLVLEEKEAEQLFAGLQASSNKKLQSIGQSGMVAIQNEPIALLVSQMNTNTAEARIDAVKALEKRFKSSSQAITIALRTYDQDKIDNLSPDGLINGLYFLSATDPAAWNQQQVDIGKQVILRVDAKNPGPKTKEALVTFKLLLEKVSSRP